MMPRSSGMGGARLLRALGRSVGAGVKENLSPAKTAKSARIVSVSSPPSSAAASSSSSNSLTCYCDGDEWETVGDGDFTNGFGFGDRNVFGLVPSKEEAEDAVSTIQQIFVPVTFSQFSEVEYTLSVDEDVVDKVVTSTDAMHSSTESESDWIEPALHIYSSKSSQSYGRENIIDAVRLMQKNPPFKRMVTSLSSDPAVWDAVMKNEVVQELKKSFYEAERSEPHISDEDNDLPTGILRRIMESTKRKLMEFFDKISKLVNDIYHSQENEKESEPLNYFVKSSFMLSVVVLIIVVVTRIQTS